MEEIRDGDDRNASGFIRGAVPCGGVAAIAWQEEPKKNDRRANPGEITEQ